MCLSPLQRQELVTGKPLFCDQEEKCLLHEPVQSCNKGKHLSYFTFMWPFSTPGPTYYDFRDNEFSKPSEPQQHPHGGKASLAPLTTNISS